MGNKKYYYLFQSTPPMQGATFSAVYSSVAAMNVSIHAPYAGSDLMRSAECQRKHSFNPRPLCRERPASGGSMTRSGWFQSTPPMQGATRDVCVEFVVHRVSNHAPYAGSDTILFFHLPHKPDVSIHAPYAGSDNCCRSYCCK